MEGAATNKRGNEPTLADVIEDAKKGRNTANFRLLRLCATFPALVALRQEERYTDWAFNGKEFEKVFYSGTVTEAESKSQAWDTWAEICEGSPRLARLGEPTNAMLAD